MKQPKYWVGLEDLEASPEVKKLAQDEFPTDLPLEDSLSQASDESLGFSTNRRDFLKIFGFGITAATLAACNQTPLKKVIPFVEKPDDLVPGVANYYSSTCAGCSAGCGVVVKTREGRPIRVDGNPDSPISQGGLCAIGQSTVLNLYDVDRLQTPMSGTSPTTWDAVDGEIKAKLQEIKNAGGKVRVLSNTVISPSTQKVIDGFLSQFDDAKHVMYDAISAYAMSRANEMTFGKKAVPAYHFDKAEVVAGFNCDFLGGWLSPVTYANHYMKLRDPKADKMSRHFQVESLMTVTGSKADLRFPIKPSEEGLALANLYNKVATKVGSPALSGVPAFNVAMNGLDKLASDLAGAKGRSLVVSGTNDLSIQMLVNGINEMLGNYGATIDLANGSNIRKGDDQALAGLVRELEAGQVDALIVYDANPVYDSPYGETFVAKLPELKLSVSLAFKTDETSAQCQYSCPDHHYLESWNDASPAPGQYSLTQPTINPIFKTRQAQDSLLVWSGSTESYYDTVQQNWKNDIFPNQSTQSDFVSFWNDSVRKGVAMTAVTGGSISYNNAGLQEAASRAISAANQAGDGLELVLYPKVSMRDGKFANNPWLQELPDPVTRVCWDNYLMVPIAFGKEQGWDDDTLVTVEVDGKSVQLPVYLQAGQAMGTVAAAVGYGRTKAGKTASKAGGANVFPMVKTGGDALGYIRSNVSVAAAGGTYQLAKFQKYNLLTDPAKEEMFGDGYDRTEHIIHETTFEDYKNPDVWGKEVAEQDEHRKHLYTLWDSHFEDPDSKRSIRWVMAIDLNKCTGCGSCVVSCHAENNIPVVGKKEIINHRDMHWMRIDRYYSGDMSNPDVVFQPLMCQHCDNAPCETVCPVLATIHSHEGLNQMAYNRCVGTRYCANNCPYKVRRFNWFLYHHNDKFDYHMNSDLGRLVLNPDVTVRYRGVMEKCSFCVQRLQEGKLRAKLHGNSTFAKPEDGDIKTACQQACPTGAIVFGDLNDPNSHVSELFRDDRGYKVLEDVKTLPSVSYMTLIRNRKADEKASVSEVHEADHA